jgi:hypothetical protein
VPEAVEVLPLNSIFWPGATGLHIGRDVTPLGHAVFDILITAASIVLSSISDRTPEVGDL